MANVKVGTEYEVFMDVVSTYSIKVIAENEGEAVLKGHATLDEILTYICPNQEFKLPDGRIIKFTKHSADIETESISTFEGEETA